MVAADEETLVRKAALKSFNVMDLLGKGKRERAEETVCSHDDELLPKERDCCDLATD